MERVGFVGLGNMGARLCDAILRNGYAVTVYDSREAATQAYLGRAAIARDTMQLLAECDILCLSLPSSKEVEPLVESWLAAGVAGKTIIDMSTSYPASTRRLSELVRAQGGRMADIPVGGTPSAAEKGTLLATFGGDRTTYESLRKLVSSFADRYEYMGESGSGHLTKLAMNFLGLSYAGLYAMLFPLTDKLGLDNEQLMRLIGGSGTNCGVFQFYAPKMVRKTYDMAFALECAHKDLTYIKRLFEDVQAPAFMLDGLIDMLRTGIRDGDGARDYSACIDTMTRYLDNVRDL